MSRDSLRFPGWPDLRIAVGCLLLLLVVGTQAAAEEGSATETSEEPTAEPRTPLPTDRIFLAPFVNASFLEAMAAEAAELQVLGERNTGVYYDKKTRLVWAAKDNGRDIDWRRANDYCSELELAGFEDWRMPTLAELEDLMEPISSGFYSTPNAISLSACCIWSSTRKDQSAWNFNFRFSKRFTGSLSHTFELRALCVREWSEADDWDPEAKIEFEVPKPPNGAPPR